MIRFELLEDLTDSDRKAKAKIWDSVILDVHNIRTKRGTYLFSGKIGVRGYAVVDSHRRSTKLKIVQIETL